MAVELFNIGHNCGVETYKCMTSSKANDINYFNIPQKELWKTSDQLCDRQVGDMCFSQKQALVWNAFQFGSIWLFLYLKMYFFC